MSGKDRRRNDVDQSISDALPFQIRCFGPSRYEFGLGLIHQKSSLLTRSQIHNSESPDTMPRAVMELLACKMRWHRSLELWEPPRGGSRRVQFDSLVRHLFAQYELPAFMPGIWLREDKLERRVFAHLAKGLSIRTAGSPIRCTRQMVPHFMTAPADLTVTQALRWAQVFAFGGDKKLARAIVGTRLRDIQADELFWDQTVAFIVRESIGPIEAVEVIDFLHRQRFQTGTRAYNLINFNQPLQPELSLKGRTRVWLRRHMANWRKDIGILEPLPGRVTHWAPADIRPFRKQRAEETWTITEITSREELGAEGGTMGHCVFSYLTRCRRNLSSIWSLQRCSASQNTRVLTIEVRPRSREIVQVRGKRNRRATGDELNLIRNWAATEQLKMTRA